LTPYPWRTLVAKGNMGFLSQLQAENRKVGTIKLYYNELKIEIHSGTNAASVGYSEVHKSTEE
jgi:hypothetical protein